MTILSRRGALGLAAGLSAPALARAQGKEPDGWPQGRSVSLVVPFTPGGGTDVVARILQEGFAESFGGNFVMEHKPGASTTVGARYVARAKPDGTTLLVGSNSAFAMAPFAYRNPGYDPLADFTHISLLYASAYLLVAHPRWGSFAQVIEAAKRAPGTLSYGTWGVGSTAHVLMLDMNERTGTEMLHVPFGGPAPALTEILAGRVDLMFTTFAPARAHVLEGRLRALGAPHEQRLAAMPAVPTMIEHGLPEFLVSAWWCLAAPAGLPAPLATALDQGARDAVARPAARRLAEEFGLLPLPLGPESMRARTRRDLALNEGLMRKAGITPE
ncbi:Bug family tripartite tricarboxylate transporter substrate binding protein [Paracraurococcus lichenis]|uniref:Tripartite tricarboxylate transporter substrate binding protein n=1 Tax=Paracraurococcus lichenis TaxID=3064888 RepID=A0ABT9E356_9PROT|nr:tripartite tricarboxylate transporter substrate binding protein [Paracraurococcus sp. LOR1-02]MDO9710583.1 tripartite tricarboxylate transporter substrate binding protein [Paracraurococcus sp. LOR1-02]